LHPSCLFGDLMLYRKSLFDQAGVNVGEIRSWQQFTEALKKSVVDGQGRHPTDSGCDESTVRVWGWNQFLARGSGAGIPWVSTSIRIAWPATTSARPTGERTTGRARSS